MKNMRIGTQIILVSFLVAIITILGLSMTSMYYFSQYAQKEAIGSVLHGITGIKNYVQEELMRLKVFRDRLGQNKRIAALVAARDTQALNTELLQLMQEANADIVVVVTKDGTVISRPHDPTRIGDNAGSEENVKLALNGQPWDMLMTGASTKLGYYCGTPIKTEDGQIVGMIRVAMSMDNESLVDKLKVLFDKEVTIFADKTRIISTIRDNDGKRVVGTDAPELIQQAVLRDGKDVEMTIMLFGSEYYVAYSPLKDPATGKIMGMYFNGKPARESNQAIRSTIMSIVMVSVIVFVIAFVISICVARRISKPLRQIVAISERGREGDLTISKKDFSFEGGGELGALVYALSEMISAQHKTMSQVVLAADEVSTHVSSLNMLSDENASAMSNSASLIKKVSGFCDVNAQAIERSVTNVSEMAEGANSVAKMTVESAESLAKATHVSKLAANSVDSLVNDIKNVNEKTSENQEKIRMLSNSVAEISNFMGVIASIADQTNLLALNAAIEAARAGEAGRGFAVVAEEVRKLAEDSRVASKSVEELVGLLSKNADEAISVSKQSVTIVNDIMSKAGASANGLNNAMSEITNVNEAIQSIAAVAEEQAAGSSEISHAIDDIERSTTDIIRTLAELSKLSEQGTNIGKSVSNSAQQMAKNAIDLKDVLTHFKI
jgi:methyl-accepting chemotaxis protein